MSPIETLSTAPATLALKPTSEPDRIFSLDVFRGFALLGILIMNIQNFSMVGDAYMNPTAYGDLKGANFIVWLFGHVFIDDKFVTIFSMLFGAGIVLMTSRVEASGRSSAALHYRRMAWIIFFGTLHAYLIWSGDILTSYGICGMLVFFCRKWKPRPLIIVGALLLAVTPAFMLFVGFTAPHWSPAQVQTLREQLWLAPPEEMAKEIAAFRGSWMTQLGPRINEALSLQTYLFAIWTFWRVTGLMLIGMACFKLGVFSGKISAGAYRAMIALAALVGIPIILYGTHKDFAHGWSFPYSLFYGTEYNYWASIPVTFGWLAAVMLTVRSAVFTAVTRTLASVGRMAFTNYIMQSLICTTIFYGHGLGLFGKVERVGQFGIVLAVWTIQLIVSPLWMRYFYFGPLEWLWRSLTYLQREPFIRNQEQQI